MKLATVILAAGLGTRMKSPLPKVLHTLCDKPMVTHVVETISTLRPVKSIVVVGAEGQKIKDALKDSPVVFAVQKVADGTAGALRAATQQLKGFSGTLLIIGGDTPLTTPELLKQFIQLHTRKKEDLSILSFTAGEGHAYGRILRERSWVTGIVENNDASEEQKKLREVNSGIYLIKSELLTLLKEIKRNPRKGEYYLTDLVGIAVKKGKRVGAHLIGDERELTGINTREELYRALHHLRERIVSQWENRGVSFLDKSSVFISPDAKIGADTLIYPNVHIEGSTIIGSNCRIYPNTRIIDCTIGDNVTIKDSTLIESSVVKEQASIGPFAHIRPGSVIGPSAKIGNFVEVKKSSIGKGTKASHLSYLGDAVIGEDVNIGAGTITCNYDGVNKNVTTIEAEVFIGSDTQLVAPVTVHKGAYVGAGSTITKDVPPLSLAITRIAQKNIDGWVARKRAVKNTKKARG